MARLIDADALLMNVVTINNSKGQVTWSAVPTTDILTAPTVDAVEVVRCKDCRHWDSETGWCNQNSAFDDNDMDWNIYNDDDFCSCGERRTDG